MPSLGTRAPDFALPDTSGDLVRLGDFTNSPGLLVMFICNHCPYVVHLRHDLAELTRTYMAKGIATVGINSNDVERYQADGPEAMVREKANQRYAFPYLLDATQEVAKAYGAACTPDFFLYDGQRQLVYRGQFDDSRPGNGLPITGNDLRRAMDRVLAGDKPVMDQTPSIGCNIKWKPGNAPDYF